MAVQVLLLLMLMMVAPVVRSFSIDRMMMKALEVNDSDGLIEKSAKQSWNDYKVEGFNETLVRLQIDMIMSLEEAMEAYPGRAFYRRRKRSAVRDESKLWPKRIPYVIDNTFSAEDQLEIRRAMQQWMQFTCLEFVPKQPRDHSLIKFKNDKNRGCLSFVGNQRLPQPIYLAPGCVYQNIIIHEIGHAIGLYHEHSRPDRDNFLTINCGNIRDEHEHNFDKEDWSVHKNYSKAYDYRSIMHYSSTAFSIDQEGKLLTIEPKDPEYTDIIGEGETISFQDAKIVNTMYKCSEGCKDKVCPLNGFLGKNCECYCPGGVDEQGEPVKLCTHQVYCDKPDIDETVYKISDTRWENEIQILTKDFSNGTVIIVEFRQYNICGYDVSNFTCSEGQWIGSLPQCEFYPCSLPEEWTAEDEYEAKDGMILHGTNLSVYCTTGKTKVTILNCNNGALNDQQSGELFDTESLGCKETALYRIIRDEGKSCPVVYNKVVKYSVIQDLERLDEGYNVRHLATVTAVCDDPDEKKEFQPEDLRKIIQCKDGQWEGSPPALCPTVRKPCNLVANAIVSGPLANSAKDEQMFDHLFEVECLPGHDPPRKTKYRCTFDGDWMPVIPTCKPRSCRIPQNYPSQLFTAEGMALIGGMDVVHGDTVRVKCNSGEVSDIEKVSCSFGKWQTKSNQLPVCKKASGCTLKEHPGVIYQVGNSFVDSGDIDHGTNVIVTVQCDAAPTDLDNLNSYQTLFCENGTLSGEVFGCPEENLGNEGEGKKCSSPRAYGVKFLPEKATYDFYEKVKITGCDDVSLIPIGSKELMCRDNGEWLGSVKCQSYCENGISNIRETEFNFFRRKSNVQYHQITDVSDLVACHTECESFKEFTCLSFEYRTDKSVCTLVNGRPNGEHFVQLGNIDVIKVYERVCDDRCRVPDPMPKDLSFLDEAWKQLVPRQVVPSGTTIKAVCKKSLKADLVTCMGGKWNKVFNDDFCQQS